MGILFLRLGLYTFTSFVISYFINKHRGRYLIKWMFGITSGMLAGAYLSDFLLK